MCLIPLNCTLENCYDGKSNVYVFDHNKKEKTGKKVLIPFTFR